MNAPMIASASATWRIASTVAVNVPEAADKWRREDQNRGDRSTHRFQPAQHRQFVLIHPFENGRPFSRAYFGDLG